MSGEWRRRIGLGAGVGVVTVLVWSVLRLSGMAAGAAMVVAALIAGVTAALAARGPRPPTPALPAPADPGPDPETLRRLRHDLRGILSPALMTADRLLMTTEDPLTRRAAETMVETIERAEKRLAG